MQHSIDASIRHSDRRKLSSVGFKAFFRVARLWDLTASEQMTLLGESDPSTFARWQSDPEVVVSADTLERLSQVLGIYKTLQLLLPNEEAADAWIKAPNAAPLFGGQPALARLLSGEMSDLSVVRQYLEFLCHGPG